MSIMDDLAREDAQVLLQHYDDLLERREALLDRYAAIEEFGEFADYSAADEERADVNEALAEIADAMAVVLRRLTAQ